MRRSFVVVVLILLAAGGVYGYVDWVDAPGAPKPTEVSVSTGDVVETVPAVGTVQPTRTVQIGTQVSGIVSKLYVDFNSIVKKGQVVAELDPHLAQAAVDSAAAALAEAKITLQQAQDQQTVDARNAARAVDLFKQGLDTAQDRDTALLQADQDKVTVTQDQAAVASATANVEQAKVNLGYCTITSPVDGVVISRDVDEGQAVAARMSVPDIYDVGTDLTKLQIVAAVDEADMSRVRPGQPVTFTVEAYPTTFRGIVRIIRLDATTTNNVVTYQTVVAVDNPDLRLRPGMTATLKIETGRVADVLRIPNDALKFRPTDAMFTALHEPVPPPVSLAASVCSPSHPCEKSAASSLASATLLPDPSGYRGPNGSIDMKFAPAPRVATSDYVYAFNDGQMTRVPVQVGITDGTWSELVSGDLKSGEPLLTALVLPNQPTAVNPLMMNRGGPRRFGGFRPR